MVFTEECKTFIRNLYWLKAMDNGKSSQAKDGKRFDSASFWRTASMVVVDRVLCV